MKVLFVYPEINPNDNPFVRTLMKGLKDQGCDVSLGRQEFWQNASNYNIIHIHWPDAMFEKVPPTDSEVNSLEKHIVFIKKTSKIIYTRHNEKPHYSNDSNRHKCYELIENNADAIIHLGNYEIESFKKRLNNTCIKHFYIPHHTYDKLYKNSITKIEAREKLKISKKKFVILTFGIYRDKEEVDMVITEFNKLLIKNKYLLAPRLISFLVKDFSNNIFIKWIFQYYYLLKLLRQKINSGSKYIDDKYLELYFKASDVVLIQRKNILNSGNISLAFYFKKPVIGPNYGNIGELLKQTNNILFEPNQDGSLCNAMMEATKINLSELGQNNYNYAINYMNIEVVAQQYYDVYKNI
jgi:hypothetical protein